MVYREIIEIFRKNLFDAHSVLLIFFNGHSLNLKFPPPPLLTPAPLLAINNDRYLSGPNFQLKFINFDPSLPLYSLKMFLKHISLDLFSMLNYMRVRSPTWFRRLSTRHYVKLWTNYLALCIIWWSRETVLVHHLSVNHRPSSFFNVSTCLLWI